MRSAPSPFLGAVGAGSQTQLDQLAVARVRAPTVLRLGHRGDGRRVVIPRVARDLLPVQHRSSRVARHESSLERVRRLGYPLPPGLDPPVEPDGHTDDQDRRYDHDVAEAMTETHLSVI
jgi:hypothetical protein